LVLGGACGASGGVGSARGELVTLFRNEALVDSAVCAFGELTQSVLFGEIPSGLCILFRIGHDQTIVFREVLPDVLGSFCARDGGRAVCQVKALEEVSSAHEVTFLVLVVAALNILDAVFSGRESCLLVVCCGGIGPDRVAAGGKFICKGRQGFAELAEFHWCVARVHLAIGTAGSLIFFPAILRAPLDTLGERGFG